MKKNGSKKNKPRTSKARGGGFRGPMPVASLKTGLPFPRSTTVALLYSEVFVMSAPASAVSMNHYYQTSLYDPRGSVGGHQPLYFDQLASIYGRYRVDKVDYVVTLSVNTGNGGVVYTRPQPNTTYETAVEALNERPDVRMTSINVYQPKTIMGSFHPHRILGVTRQKYKDDPNYSAVVTANPNIMAYLFNYFYTFTEATQYNVSVTLKFHSTFYEYQTVAQS